MNTLSVNAKYEACRLLAAMSPLDAINVVPTQGLVQIFTGLAAFELYELTHRNGAIVEGERIAPGLGLGWNPLKITIDDNRRRLAELQNGRAAMFAICAWVAAEAIPGSAPLPLPW